MSLPDKPNTVTKILPSYLYFQYQDDDDLPALINAYNTLAQGRLDDIIGLNLPIYTQLTGTLLDWVGAGLYGKPRPIIPYDPVPPIFGPTATYPLASHPLVWMAPTSGPSTYDVTDDIYKRILTWWFYKGDGFEWSVPWLKRRIYRFLYGINGTAPDIGYTPNVSVTFPYGFTPHDGCEGGCGCCYNCGPGNTVPIIEIAIYNTDQYTAELFGAALQAGVLNLPFRFNVVVDIKTIPFLVLDNQFKGLDHALLWLQPAVVPDRCLTYLQLDNPNLGLDKAHLGYMNEPIQLDSRKWGLDSALFGYTMTNKPLLFLDSKCAGLDCALLGNESAPWEIPFLYLDDPYRQLDRALLWKNGNPPNKPYLRFNDPYRQLDNALLSYAHFGPAAFLRFNDPSLGLDYAILNTT